MSPVQLFFDELLNSSKITFLLLYIIDPMDNDLFVNMWQIMRQHRLEIIDDISSDCRCTICEKILIDACNTNCGCRFCMECIKEYLNGKLKMCPGESEYCKIEMINPDGHIQRDRPINVKISKLKALCTNVGCQEVIELKMMANHLRTCDKRPLSCPYLELGCEERVLLDDQLRKHLLTSIYPHAELIMKWMSNSRNEAESLKKEVEKLIADSHQYRERTDKVIQDLQRKERDSVCEMEKLNEEIRKLKNVNEPIDDKARSIEDNKAEQVQMRIQIPENRQCNSCHMIEIICDEVQDQANITEEVEMSLDKMLKATANLKVPNLKKVKSAENMHESPDKREDFVWKIDNWTERVKKARKDIDKEIYSNSFFSHENGYKMCLATWPGGVYLYLCFYIMRGPFDDVMHWPFDKTIELSLMNQQTGLAYATQKKECSEDPHYIGYQKPTSARNDSASGLTFFIKVDQLATNPALCQNNQIIISCSVKPSVDINQKRKYATLQKSKFY